MRTQYRLCASVVVPCAHSGNPAPLHAGLTALRLATRKALTRLPPALSAATGLRQLDLSGNLSLTVTDADAEWVMAHMPTLEAVALSHTLTDRAVKLQLDRALWERRHPA